MSDADPTNPKRPLSLTLVAWYLIGSALFAVIGIAALYGSPLLPKATSRIPVPLALQWVVAGAQIVISIVSGVAILRRREWGRHLYGWSAGAMLVYDFLVSPARATNIISLLLYALVIFFLFRGPATRWFERGHGEDTLSRIFG